MQALIERLATQDQPPQLGPATNTDSSNQATQTQRMVIDAYATAILEQPVITLSDIPNLAPNLQTAQQHATFWNNTVRPGLIQANTDLIDFGNQWNSFFPILMNEAQNLDQGTNLQDFIQGVTLLQQTIQQKETNSNSALGQLNTYQSDVTSDQANFAADLQQGNEIYEGTQGEIAQLQQEATAQQKAMNRDLTIIGLGATVDVVSGLAIAVGVLGEIETAGVSTALIAAGLVGIAAGSGAAGYAIYDYNKQASNYASTIQQIQSDQNNMAALASMSTQMTSLYDAGQGAVTALTGMTSSWQLLDTQFGAVVSDLNEVNTPQEAQQAGPFLVADLQQAQQGWNSVMQTANHINAELLNLPVQQASN